MLLLYIWTKHVYTLHHHPTLVNKSYLQLYLSIYENICMSHKLFFQKHWAIAIALVIDLVYFTYCSVCHGVYGQEYTDKASLNSYRYGHLLKFTFT